MLRPRLWCEDRPLSPGSSRGRSQVETADKRREPGFPRVLGRGELLAATKESDVD